MSEAVSTEAKSNGAVASVLSKRAVQRLAEMQHSLSAEMRSLSEQHSRFIGALMACDIATQQTMMMEYREQLHTIHTIIAKLRMLLERFSDERDA